MPANPQPEGPTAILHGALEVIAAEGVHKTTHRKIAAAAGVSPGLCTYHFADLQEILERAFALLGDTLASRYAALLPETLDREGAVEAVTTIICGPEVADRGDQQLIYEMYAYAGHDEAVGTMAAELIARSYESLAPHFGERARVAIDALIEGWTIHRTLQSAPPDRALVRDAVAALAAL
ncbi:TetR/AcrR family transcriptional regulator [Gulosibacter sp. 10]|uniref:TetR/AcrR family transcriptional regulator n=1 Tax=Gulosibacter sp. 10 TaxID=1255570 RepID=UPI00097F1E18|nr:TetR family transcriptional regulator [Gulosibacter sp. 10]SJM65195.1 Transcriptional regulator, TetR family [Gulosibacter sp. 10]